MTRQSIRQLDIPPELASRLLLLPDAGRAMSIRICAGRGTGKSTLMGRVIAWLDFLRGVPTVIIDPLGVVIDHVLDKTTRLPRRTQETLWPRMRYVDMAASQDLIVGWPLYHRRDGESLYAVAQRPLEVWRRLDPYLQSASIQGWNSLARVGTAAGMVVTALELQIGEAEDLVRHPEQWSTRLAEAVAREPQAAPAAAFFTDELLPLPTRERLQRTQAFLTKVAPFTLDPRLHAQFGSGTPGIDWQEVVDQGLLVALDFRHELDLESLRFKLLWVFRSLTDFIKARGPGRHTPISLIVDELTFLTAVKTAQSDLLADDLEELISRLSRNHAVWLTLSHQELNQFGPRLQAVLMTCGTQILGGTSDPVAAQTLADRFARYNPYLIKKTENVYSTSMGEVSVIDERSIEFTLEEQRYMASQPFLKLPRFHFLVAAAQQEGTLPTLLEPVSIEGVDPGQYVQPELVARGRTLLMERDGRPIADVAAEIAARHADRTTPAPALRREPTPVRRMI